MNCPRCQAETTVSETRISPAGMRRRRHCACGHRFTTIEVIVPVKSRHAGPMLLVSRNSFEKISALLADAPIVPDEGEIK